MIPEEDFCAQVRQSSGPTDVTVDLAGTCHQCSTCTGASAAPKSFTIWVKGISGFHAKRDHVAAAVVRLTLRLVSIFRVRITDPRKVYGRQALGGPDKKPMAAAAVRQR